MLSILMVLYISKVTFQFQHLTIQLYSWEYSYSIVEKYFYIGFLSIVKIGHTILSMSKGLKFKGDIEREYYFVVPVVVGYNILCSLFPLVTLKLSPISTSFFFLLVHLFTQHVYLDVHPDIAEMRSTLLEIQIQILFSSMLLFIFKKFYCIPHSYNTKYHIIFKV